MHLIFMDPTVRQLWPLTMTRPVAELRCGIFTLREKWEQYLGKTGSSHWLQSPLSEKFPIRIREDNLLINGAVFPDKNLVAMVRELENGACLFSGQTLIARRCSGADLRSGNMTDPDASASLQYPDKVMYLHHTWDIFVKNGEAIQCDWERLELTRSVEGFEATNTFLGEAIYIHPEAKVQGAVLNATDGPVYIGKGAEVMEGSLVRGPFALCDHATLKMGTKIYGATTIGPHCKVGGEVSNSVFQGYSNKGHDGFVGNSVIGEWCNLGADTNTSNLKNNYGEVKVWSYEKEGMINSKQQFVGLTMGDHSKCGINTMFNTGTVVGVNCNIFGADFPPAFIPSFSWGGAAGFTRFQLEKAFEVAERVMERRKMTLTNGDKVILQSIFKNEV